MVEVVERLAHPVARVHGPGRAVGLVEAGAEAAEELGHGEVGLAVAVVDGRVVDDGLAVGQRRPVAAPEVAVQQRGRRTVALEEGGQRLEQAPAALEPGASVAAALGELELEAQAALAPEGHPVVHPAVGLRGRADGVVAPPAVALLGGDGVHGGEALAEARLGPRPARAEGQALEDEKGPPLGHAPADGLRHAHGARAGDLGQPLGLGLEHVEALGVVELHEPVAPRAAQARRAVDAAAADVLGALGPEGPARGLGDARGDRLPEAHGPRRAAGAVPATLIASRPPGGRA